MVMVALTALPATALWFHVTQPLGPDWYVPSEEICRRHLEGLADAWFRSMWDRPGPPKANGPSCFLGLRKRHVIPVGGEELFLCPDDDDATVPSTAKQRAAYDAVVRNVPGSFKGLISYAVRDFKQFPLSAVSVAPRILAADRCGPKGRTPHHSGGLNVLWDDGKATFLTWAELGFPPDGPEPGSIIVGPGSASPELSKLIVPP